METEEMMRKEEKSTYSYLGDWVHEHLSIG